MILPEVDQAILELIRDSVNSLPKTSIVIQKSTSPPKKIPIVYLWNRSFTASDVSIGAAAPETGERIEDRFSGDGKNASFKLSNPPLRPHLSVTLQGRTMREGRDYRVDYSKGTLTFLQAPEKGQKNIQVSYASGKGASEVRAQRLRLTYNLDIWASEQSTGGTIMNEVASALLLSRDYLASQDIQLRLTGGRDVTDIDGIPDGLFCKRLECVAEADLFVKRHIPRIERIDFKKPEKA
jgi:hypothetical protein